MSLSPNTHQNDAAAEQPVRPLGLLIAFLREVGGTIDDEKHHERLFLNRINEDGYEDFRDAVVSEWFSIKYSTAFTAAHPPTAQQLLKRSKAAKKTTSQLKLALIAGFLKLTMPNGKKLSDCTGKECIAFGGLFQKIGERVGPDKRIGDVLTEKQIAALVV
jgi:hypothetical protein